MADKRIGAGDTHTHTLTPDTTLYQLAFCLRCHLPPPPHPLEKQHESSIVYFSLPALYVCINVRVFPF